MKTYTITDAKEMAQFKDDYWYKVDGNLKLECLFIADKSLFVDGNLIIEAGGDIKARGHIKARGYIKAVGDIEARGYIEAGGDIKAGGHIKGGWYIESGWYIEAIGDIESGWYIEVGGDIESGGDVKARGDIKAGGHIKAGGDIKAVGAYGISAGSSITCGGVLKYGVKCFSGRCIWRNITDEEKTISCGKHEGGVIDHGILKETGLEPIKWAGGQNATTNSKTRYGKETAH